MVYHGCLSVLTLKYAEVILPLSLANRYTYRIPPDLEPRIFIGSCVIVQFGVKRFYTAIVWAIHTKDESKNTYEIKEIYALLDPIPVLRQLQLRFWEWLSFYYCCRLGDVYNAAVPSGLKLESETAVMYNENFEADSMLRPAEQSVLEAFSGQTKLTISELEKKTGLRNVMPVISSLMALGAVEVCEELKHGFKPKTQTYIRLSIAFHAEEQLSAAFNSLKRAHKQMALLSFFLEEIQMQETQMAQEISKKELLKRSGCSATVLDELLKRGILESYEKEVERLQPMEVVAHVLNCLSEEQQSALRQIQDVFRIKDVCLLHGITSSGKTEIYIHLIDEILQKGKQVLYLLPEIALTTQITKRLSYFFGDRMLVYHSRFSDSERVEIWNRILRGNDPLLVVGVRSSLFLPFGNIGLIIVDEEHDHSYKQQDPAPRYHARNAAIVLAGMHGAKTLLGSATPSIDSYYNALAGKYGLVDLSVRYGEVRVPEILTVDIRELKRKKRMNNALFSPLMIEKIDEALKEGEQAILFQNRRGFAPVLECNNCGWVPHCVNCDVSLTYHKQRHELTCHYCGYRVRVPKSCPTCGEPEAELRSIGFGTEKVEEEIKALFPAARVGRLDFDTAHTRTAFERILSDFEQGNTDILIGTQMVSKGLDFANVSVVGILNADSLMNIPDFRAHERAFQLLVQVSGRSGRRNKRGTVVLQTFSSEHPIIRLAVRSDYKEMARLQLEERKLFRYPPYFRIIEVVLRSRKEDVVHQISFIYADKLRNHLNERILGPVVPPIARIQAWYIRKIILKIEITVAIAPVRTLLDRVSEEMEHLSNFRQVAVHYDVDPV